MSRIILDLCGGTGSWSKPYADAGYEVIVITLPVFDVTQVEFDDYGMEFIKQGLHHETLFVPYCDVHGILAAPPCTEFSIAKSNKPRDFAGAMEIVLACFQIIWNCRIMGNLKFWAMENPVGFLRQFIGIPSYQFEHWEFGDQQIKRTDLWGYFKPPRKTVANRPENLTIKFASRINGRGWSKPACPTEYRHLRLDRAAVRAITPPGFAKAFFKANK